MATTASTIVAAMAARARREIRERFDQSDAYQPERAMAYDPPTNMHRRQFDLLIGRGIVHHTGDGRYWLDRDAERAERERNRAAAILMVKIILAGFALAIAGVAIWTALR